jgi:hypothetical protein
MRYWNAMARRGIIQYYIILYTCVCCTSRRWNVFLSLVVAVVDLIGQILRGGGGFGVYPQPICRREQNAFRRVRAYIYVCVCLATRIRTTNKSISRMRASMYVYVCVCVCVVFLVLTTVVHPHVTTHIRMCTHTGTRWAYNI